MFYMLVTFMAGQIKGKEESLVQVQCQTQPLPMFYLQFFKHILDCGKKIKEHTEQKTNLGIKSCSFLLCGKVEVAIVSEKLLYLSR